MKLRLFLGASLLLLLAAGAGAFWFYQSFLVDLPNLDSVSDYRPPVLSTVLDRKGRPIGEFFNERRRMASIDEIPEHTKRAFVSAEDANFYEHQGIDYRAILRAAYVDVMAGSIEQGASTITMQTTKQLLLNPEKKFRRKLREMILAREIEQHLSKDEILYLYLNQIYFGHGAHGIGEAARAYFDKPVSELTVSESALLAGLPQRPSDYSPHANPKAAESRRRYVLRRMFEDKVIDEPSYEEALASPPELRDPEEWSSFQDARYFNEEVRRYLYERLGGDVVLNEGLVIETTLDIDLQLAAVRSLRTGLEDHDRRQGYRGPLRKVPAEEIADAVWKLGEDNGLVLDEDDVERGRELKPFEIGDRREALITEVDAKGQRAKVALGPEHEAVLYLEDNDWARVPDPDVRPRPVEKITKIVAVGDVVKVERLESSLRFTGKKATKKLADEQDPETPIVRLWQKPKVQGALLSLEVATGDVLAMVGGYDYDASEFNRATQAFRQAGSAFKPFIYGAAIARDHTPVDIIYDRPAVYTDPVSGFVWRPQNYGRKFYGPITMRAALVRSINNATVHLFRDVGVDYVIDYARRLGIQAPLSRDLSLALGSSEMPLVELTRAYAVYPNGGRRVTPRFISRVTDREGHVLLEDIALGASPPPVLKPLPGKGEERQVSYPDSEILPSDRIMSEDDAYLMCDMLKAVVIDPRGTGYRLRRLGRPVAGKTGTTNNQADAWFMGFSPDIATGVWVGYDEKKVLGWGETGSRAAAPIWVDYMEVALKDRPARDFSPPSNIVFRSIDRETGVLADHNTADAYFQPFRAGNAPTDSTTHVLTNDDAARALRNDAF